MRRRRLLAVLAVGLAGLSGCGGSDSDPNAEPARAEDTGPYRGAGALLPTPRGVRVRNAGVDERYVTLAVDDLRRGESDGSASADSSTEAFRASATLSRAGTVTYPAIVATAGTYRLFVETADGRRAIHDWVVEGARSDLDVALDEDEVRFTPVVTCTPTCPPVSRAVGEAAPGDPVDRPTVGASSAVNEAFGPGPALRVDNRGVGWRTVRISFAAAGRAVTSRYSIPPDARLVLPVGGRDRALSVTVASEGSTARTTWPTVVPELFATVTEEGVEFGCGGDSGRCHLVNDDDESHDVTVRVDPLTDGARTIERCYRLNAGGYASDAALFDHLGPFALTVRADTGSSERYDWLTCPSVGPWYVVVDGEGRVRVSQPVPSSVAG
ncbi:hypothetical protein [Haloprofundus salilacus]|uniref:hypothetical protein n=1 Tax=Haloprofundus salilacus TaxID=2876190 RepID=UPI001CCFCEF1|nr:hypothetical protein [Haloprofundus salilacus]